MWKEFREFIMRGNVLDLAIGVIIGGAFGAIVNSLVNDILMPPIGLLIGGVDFTDIFIALDGGTYASLAAAQEAGAPTINIGLFINAIIQFLIIAVAIFFLIRSINRMMRAEEKKEEAPAAPPEPTVEEKMLVELQKLNENLKR